MKKRGLGISILLSLLITMLATVTISTKIAKAVTAPIGVKYSSHVQNIGWQPYVSDGQEAGTDGKGLRVEALNIKLVNAPADASIEYQGHVQNIGWQTPIANGEEVGTDGKGLRVEAVKIALKNLPGYSVQYRAHVQNIGWQPWVSDGAEAGTDGKGLRVEALQIKIVKTPDGSTPTPVPFIDNTNNSVKYFPLLSDVPMPQNVDYYGTYKTSDGLYMSYIYSASSLSDSLMYDYDELLQNSAWKLSGSGTDTDGRPYIAYSKGSNIIYISTDGDNIIILGNIH